MVKKWKKKLYNFKQLESAWFMGRNSKHISKYTFTRRFRKSINNHYSKMPRIWKRGNDTEPSWCLESQSLYQDPGENSQPTTTTIKRYVKNNMNQIYM
jgi:hypothetical protein